MVFIVAALYFVAWVFLTQTRAGARLQAVGGSAEAVRRIGVNADAYRILGFIARCDVRRAGRPGDRRHDPAGLAVGVGEPAVRGAHGRRPVRHAAHRRPRQLPRVLVGTLIIATINSALVIRGIQPYWTTIITGVLLILALVFEKVMTTAVTARLTTTSDQSVHATGRRGRT